ncbi:aminopeptidase P family protein [Bacillus horti]|uniref:Xaa-Pro aminopeptidase n=1 Tax=Caldalkalibacillus horti TaxID=77523 RepID=A0ABT9W404_9BACI|nr:aminopeptidase P family protein [Bacillus horti]MDQ0167967.1 Xaa-Pro aminopeptidase [Bacillus horti]
MEKTFFIQNRKKVAKLLEYGIVLLHSGVKARVSSQETYDFRPNKMFYYLTGLSEPNLVLMLCIEHAEVKEFLLIPELDPVKQAWDGKQLDKDSAAQISGVEHIFDLGELQRVWDYLLYEYSYLPIWMNIKDGQLRELCTHFNLAFETEHIECIHEKLSFLRSFKEPEEIEKLSQVSKVAALGVQEAIKKSKPGLYEYQVEAFHDYVMKSNGLKPGHYKTILAAGQNATILHYLDNDSIIEGNDLILMDIDVEIEQYHCDCTRVFPASGRFTERQKQIYSAVLHVQKGLISYLKPGVTYGELNEYAKALLGKACQKLNVLHEHNKLEDYYFHQVGHAIGLDTHDVGVLEEDTVLKPGMVLTIEPGLYIQEEQIGVRIEDMVAVTENGNINLTEHLVKEIEDIEQLMARG